MDLRLQLDKLSTPEDIQKLVSIISELAESLDILYTETAPNSNISDRIGRIAIYKNGSAYEQWQNVDGGTTWQRMDYGIIDYFKTGDWIISSVTTARTGWTNVSATYSNKFMRINATPLSTGGADTVTLSEANLPSHTHAAGTLTIPDVSADSGGGYNFAYDAGGDNPIAGTPTLAVSGSTGAIGSGTAVDTVPAYVQVCIFQKD